MRVAKFSVASLTLALLLGSVGVASAITTAGTSTVPTTNKAWRNEVQDFRTNTVKPAMQTIKEQRDGLKGQSSTTKAEIRTTISNERAAIKEQRQVLMQDLRKKLAEGLRARTLKSLEKMDEALTRIEDINKRIGVRITKLEAAGTNPITAKELLAIAVQKDSLARTAVIDARNAIAGAVISTSTNMIALKENLKNAETSVKDARAATVDAIASIKGLGENAQSLMPKEPKATSTATSTD